jgi:hypothetical protein
MENETYIDSVSGKTLYVKRFNGHVSYYKNSERTVYHREDGPAVKYASGTTAWYRNGRPHRIDGIAIKFAGGIFHDEYYVNGVQLNPERLQNKLNMLKLLKR